MAEDILNGDDLPTRQAIDALIEAATAVVGAYMQDRVPPTRHQTLALLKLANATLLLEALLHNG